MNSNHASTQPSPPAYPEWLEAWWKERARRQLGARDFPETQRELEREVQRLSDLFTTGRESRFGDYARDERLLLAYGLFYFPQTFARVQFPLRELLVRLPWRPGAEGGRIRLLDLGAGLGAATLGAALQLQQLQSASAIEALAVDQSAASLAVLAQLARENAGHLARVRVRTARGDLKTWFRGARPHDRWDLISASFSLGEAFFGARDEDAHQWLKVVLRHLRPGGVALIVEPALRETSERIERLRNLVAAEGSGRILAPCPHRGTCPLLATGKHWCHEVRTWPVPDSLSFLNRRLFRSVRDLKFSFLAVAPTSQTARPSVPLPAGLMRLVSPVSEMKGRYLWTGCTGDGQRREYEIQKRDLAPEEERQLLAIERGDVLEVLQSEVLGDPNRQRVNAFRDLRYWSQSHGGEAGGPLSGHP